MGCAVFVLMMMYALPGYCDFFADYKSTLINIMFPATTNIRYFENTNMYGTSETKYSYNDASSWTMPKEGGKLALDAAISGIAMDPTQKRVVTALKLLKGSTTIDTLISSLNSLDSALKLKPGGYGILASGLIPQIVKELDSVRTAIEGRSYTDSTSLIGPVISANGSTVTTVSEAASALANK